MLSTTLSSIDVFCTSPSDGVVSHCKHCLNGKIHQFCFPKSDFHASRPLELIHSNVWGPALVTSTNDFQYYILFIDDYSKFTWLYLLKHKSDVLDVFKFLMCSSFLKLL